MSDVGLNRRERHDVARPRRASAAQDFPPHRAQCRGPVLFYDAHPMLDGVNMPGVITQFPPVPTFPTDSVLALSKFSRSASRIR
jgi:hypothetical protein